MAWGDCFSNADVLRAILALMPWVVLGRNPELARQHEAPTWDRYRAVNDERGAA